MLFSTPLLAHPTAPTAPHRGGVLALTVMSKDALNVQMASCFESGFLARVGLFQAPSLTRAHKIIGTASVIGFLFAVAHPLTVLVTLLYDGADWGATAWTMDVLGYLAGVGVAFLCRNCSNKERAEVKQDAFWILVWSAITFCVRVLDIAMLTGVVEIEAIYHTPTGPTLYANIVSEIVIAFPYSAFALVGSFLLYKDATIC
jgi:hypothetical protein